MWRKFNKQPIINLQDLNAMEPPTGSSLTRRRRLHASTRRSHTHVHHRTPFRPTDETLEEPRREVGPRLPLMAVICSPSARLLPLLPLTAAGEASSSSSP